MSNESLKTEIVEYISKTRWAILATVRDDLSPVLRTMGSFAPDRLDIYFSTGKGTEKVKQIEENNSVSIFFQQEGQELNSFKNVAVIGEANRVTETDELQRAVGLLSDRNPRFKERIERGELENIAIFRIKPKEIKRLDFSKGIGKDAVEEIIL